MGGRTIPTIGNLLVKKQSTCSKGCATWGVGMSPWWWVAIEFATWLAVAAIVAPVVRGGAMAGPASSATADAPTGENPASPQEPPLHEWYSASCRRLSASAKSDLLGMGSQVGSNWA